jgi:hypothetical protein
MKFYELAVGAVFTAWGRTYRKTAMSMAVDARLWACVFFGETEVVSDGPLLPPEVAAIWKPNRGHWAAVVESAVNFMPEAACHENLNESARGSNSVTPSQTQ